MTNGQNPAQSPVVAVHLPHEGLGITAHAEIEGERDQIATLEYACDDIGRLFRAAEWTREDHIEGDVPTLQCLRDPADSSGSARGQRAVRIAMAAACRARGGDAVPHQIEVHGKIVPKLRVF